MDINYPEDRSQTRASTNATARAIRTDIGSGAAGAEAGLAASATVKIGGTTEAILGTAVLSSC